jgi:hypothetical protein
MPSKTRGKLSAREYAAKQKGTSVSYGAKVASAASKVSKTAKTPSFKFDAKKATKQYTERANAIYDPQIQQAQNQQGINLAQAEQSKVTTRKQFADLLTKTIESINNRGAFFGGGAITQENAVNTDATNALTGIDQATTQANLGLSSDIAQLGGKKADYISSGVNSDQSSAYSQFQDYLQNYFKQAGLKADAASAQLDQSNKDRAYNLDVQKMNEPKTYKPTQPVDENKYWKPVQNPRTGQVEGRYNSYTNKYESTQY